MCYDSPPPLCLAKLFLVRWHKVLCVCVSPNLSFSVWLNKHTFANSKCCRYHSLVWVFFACRTTVEGYEGMCLSVCSLVCHCVNFQLELTSLLITPRRLWSITVINKDRLVCMETPTSLGVWWQQQREIPNQGWSFTNSSTSVSLPLILLCNYDFPLLGGSGPRNSWGGRSKKEILNLKSSSTTRTTARCPFIS